MNEPIVSIPEVMEASVAGGPTLHEELLRHLQNEPSSQPDLRREKLAPGPIDAAVLDWSTILYRTYVTGDLPIEQGQRLLEELQGESAKTELVRLAHDPTLSRALQRNIDRSKRELPGTSLPGNSQEVIRLSSEEPFSLYNAKTGRSRMVSSFDTQFSMQVAKQMATTIEQFIHDRDPRHLDSLASLALSAGDMRELYREISINHLPQIHALRERMQYLGLTRNLDVEGQGAELIRSLAKAAEFGHLTPEDRGKNGPAPRNRIVTGENPAMVGLNPALSDQALLSAIRTLTTLPELEALKQKYGSEPVTTLIDWTVRQVVVRELLPREASVPVREIDLNTMRKLKSLSESDMGDHFQASNPVSLWEDPKTGRRFFAKECPEHTLQADYFGLEMLQLSGVPIYEFYTGFVPGADSQPPRRVLVTGFLEGYKDPSELVELPEGAPEVMKKFRLPEHLHDSRDIQRALLVELLIGEYNSRAHNFMVLGDSVMHLDQGGALTSTASGKFKGLSERIAIQDIEDILSSHPDWDFHSKEPTNEAYANIAEVIDGKLVIHDIDFARSLQQRLALIPARKIDEALEKAGYENGERSKARMRGWIQRIETDLLPQFRARMETTPSPRAQQYIRWAESARETFERAIEMGGELAYYQSAMRTRRESLIDIWNEAIQRAEASR